MGTIVGTFFSDRTMDSIKRDRDKKKKDLVNTRKQLKNELEYFNNLLKGLH
tara:strand:+ start:149 stop:301 length:153 start_codon:yes stop_codon:yes gene_type:complete